MPKCIASIRLPLLLITVSLLNLLPCKNLVLAEPRMDIGKSEYIDSSKKVQLLDELLQEHGLSKQKLASLYFQRALAFKESKDYFRALEDLDTAMGLSKRFSDILLEKSECLLMVDQLDQASLALEHFLLTRPGNARAYTLKGMIYERGGAYLKAHDEYTRALVHDPVYFPALESRANVFLKEGKPRKAIEDLDVLIKLNPERPESFILRAAVHSKMRDYLAALADFTKAETLRPDNERLRRERVALYLKINKPQQALELLSTSRQTAEDANALLLLARAQILSKNWKKAESILNEIDSKWPNNAEGKLLRGNLYNLTGRLDDSLGSLNTAIQLDSKLVEAYRERAKVLIQLKEFVRAVNDLTLACEIDPADGEIYTLRGEAQYQRRMYNAAEADFGRALETLTDDPRVLYDKALVHLRKGDFQKAFQEFDKVLILSPDESRFLSMRGVTRFFLGDLEMAIQDLERSVLLAPTNPLVLNNRGFFYLKIGNFSAARADFEAALKFSPSFVDAGQNLRLTDSRELEGNFITEPGK